VVLPLVLALAGCGSDDGTGDSSGDGSGGSTDGGTSSASPTGTASPTTTPSEPEPTATTEPASGPELEVEGIRVNAPARWKGTYDTVFVDSAQGREGALMLSVAGTAGDELSPREAERYFWNQNRKPPHFQRRGAVEMSGLTAGYYTAHDRYDDIHAVTLWDSGYVVKVDLRFGRDVPDDRQQELLDSVVASYSSPGSS
jgi:hypothetical protein